MQRVPLCWSGFKSQSNVVTRCTRYKSIVNRRKLLPAPDLTWAQTSQLYHSFPSFVRTGRPQCGNFVTLAMEEEWEKVEEECNHKTMNAHPCGSPEVIQGLDFFLGFPDFFRDGTDLSMRRCWYNSALEYQSLGKGQLRERESKKWKVKPIVKLGPSHVLG